MDKQLAEIKAYLEEVNAFALPKYKELPGVALYMEQVLSYINGLLSSLTPSEAKPLTSFMVNNYVKAKMIDEPEKKKYGKEQIGYLIAITLMKTTVSMSDMAVFLKLDQGISPNKEKIYRFWSDMEGSILSETSKKTSSRVDGIAKRYANDAKANREEAKANARDALGLIAMRLAIQAQANKLLSDYIISKLDESLREDDKTETKKQTKEKKKKETAK